MPPKIKPSKSQKRVNKPHAPNKSSLEINNPNSNLSTVNRLVDISILDLSPLDNMLNTKISGRLTVYLKKVHEEEIDKHAKSQASITCKIANLKEQIDTLSASKMEGNTPNHLKLKITTLNQDALPEALETAKAAYERAAIQAEIDKKTVTANEALATLKVNHERFAQQLINKLIEYIQTANAITIADSSIIGMSNIVGLGLGLGLA